MNQGLIKVTMKDMFVWKKMKQKNSLFHCAHDKMLTDEKEQVKRWDCSCQSMLSKKKGV